MHAKWPALRISNVEEFCEFAEGPVLQHVIPPWIVLRRGHVVRHDVEQNAQFEGSGRIHKTGPRLLAAEIVADFSGIYDIVTMQTAWHRLQARREVNMADSQLSQVRQNALGRT